MTKKRIKITGVLLAVILLTGIVLPACTKGNVTVLFDVNCPSSVVVENEPDSVTIAKGSPVAEPTPAPKRSGYDFKGWYTDANCTGDAYDFSTPVNENNFVLYAKWEVTITWYTVSFNYNGKGTNSSVQVKKDETVSPPAVSDTADAFFDGWYREAAGTTPYVASAPVTESLTLYAKWTNAYTVTFNLRGGTTTAETTQKLREGATPAVPAQPTLAGYSFAGWCTDADATVAYTFGPVSSSFNLYARWVSAEAPKHTVTFDLKGKGNTAVPSQQITSGAVIENVTPTDPTYRFMGWYTDSELKNAYNVNTPVTADLTLYAKWLLPVNITFDYNYTNSPAARVDEYMEGDLLASPANPSRGGGYTFAGWSTASDGILDIVFGGAVSASATYYAQWYFTKVYEAENTDLEHGHDTLDGAIIGWGWSGGMSGTGLIAPSDDTENKTASNGAYLWYLMAEGATITFNVYSDRDITGAELSVRLSAEIFDTLLYYDTVPANADELFADSTRKASEPNTYEYKAGKYTFKVNGVAISYTPIVLKDVPDMTVSVKRDFEDFTINNISLNKGLNEIKLITDNSDSIGGTTTATAPLLDCIQIRTFAKLS